MNGDWLQSACLVLHAFLQRLGTGMRVLPVALQNCHAYDLAWRGGATFAGSLFDHNLARRAVQGQLLIVTPDALKRPGPITGSA
jgi:hypothetical protein